MSSFLLGIHLGVDFLGPRIAHVEFSRLCQMVFQRTCNHLRSLQQPKENPLALYLCQHLTLSTLLIFTILVVSSSYFKVQCAGQTERQLV